MSVVTRLLSSGVARGLAALLAVLLSAVIGGRLGVERLSLDHGDEECSPVACPLVVDQQGDLPDAALVGGVVCTGTHARLLAVATVPSFPEHRPFPGLLRGSAGGARAP